MKQINTYINERFILSRNTDCYTCHPKDRNELNEILRERKSDYWNGRKHDELLDLNDIDVSNIEDMSDLFYGTRIKHIDVSSWNVSRVKDMNRMFFASQFVSIGDISNWKTHGVKNMKYMFAHADKLEKMGNISNWDISNVDKMDGMFEGTKNLTTDEVGNFNNWKLNSVCTTTDMFEDSGIDLPDLL